MPQLQVLEAIEVVGQRSPTHPFNKKAALVANRTCSVSKLSQQMGNTSMMHEFSSPYYAPKKDGPDKSHTITKSQSCLDSLCMKDLMKANRYKKHQHTEVEKMISRAFEESKQSGETWLVQCHWLYYTGCWNCIHCRRKAGERECHILYFYQVFIGSLFGGTAVP